MNDLLSTSIGHGINEAKDEREELEEKVIDTVEYLIRHDRLEIEELLNTFHCDKLFEDDVNQMLPHKMNFGAFVPISRYYKLDPYKAAKIQLDTLDISAFVSITRCTKLDFNTTVKI